MANFGLLNGAFEIGRQVAGTSPLAEFAKTLTGRAQELGLIREKAQIESAEKLRMAGPIAGAEAAAKFPYQEKLLQTKAANQPIKSLSGEGSGKLALARVGESSVQAARGLLFPSGTPESFRKDLATWSTNPISRATGWGGPKKDLQRVYSNLKRAYLAKIRIESGAAIPQSEINREI